MQQLIFSQIAIEELQALLSGAVKTELENYIPKIQPTNQQQYITRKEAAKVLGVSLTTLNA